MNVPHNDNLKYLNAEFQELMQVRAALREERAVLREASAKQREAVRQLRVEMADLWKTLRAPKTGWTQ